MDFDTDEAMFLDTSLIVAATVELHPSHKVASEFVDGLVSQIGQPCISP